MGAYLELLKNVDLKALAEDVGETPGLGTQVAPKTCCSQTLPRTVHSTHRRHKLLLALARSLEVFSIMRRIGATRRNGSGQPMRINAYPLGYTSMMHEDKNSNRKKEI